MSGWTPERRARQAELIHQWKPWEKAGVKTDEGKEVSKMNALKHGLRSVKARELKRLLREHHQILEGLGSED